jgi:hypothetical protein
MIDQPEARHDHDDDDSGGGKVLLHAAAILLFLESADGIGDRAVGCSVCRCPPPELQNPPFRVGVTDTVCRGLVLSAHANFSGRSRQPIAQ